MTVQGGPELRRDTILRRVKSHLVRAGAEILDDESGRAVDGLIKYLSGVKKRLAEIQGKRKNNSQ